MVDYIPIFLDTLWDACNRPGPRLEPEYLQKNKCQEVHVDLTVLCRGNIPKDPTDGIVQMMIKFIMVLAE
jgi:hypothetical protein